MSPSKAKKKNPRSPRPRFWNTQIYGGTPEIPRDPHKLSKNEKRSKSFFFKPRNSESSKLCKSTRFCGVWRRTFHLNCQEFRLSRRSGFSLERLGNSKVDEGKINVGAFLLSVCLSLSLAFTITRRCRQISCLLSRRETLSLSLSLRFFCDLYSP